MMDLVDMFEFIDMKGLQLGCNVGLTLMVKCLVIPQDSLYHSVRTAVL